MEVKDVALKLKAAGFKIEQKDPDRFYLWVDNIRYLIAYNKRYYHLFVKVDQPEE